MDEYTPNHISRSLLKGYKEPTCGRSRDDSAFKRNFLFALFFGQKEPTDECNKCRAPIWCHFSLNPLCNLTRQELESNEAKYLVDGLCIVCLKKKVCCLALDHLPSKEDKKRKAPEEDEPFSKKLNFDSEVFDRDFYIFFSSLCKKDNIIKNTSIEKIGTNEDNIPEEQRRIWSFKDKSNDPHWLSEDYNDNYFLNRECYDYFLNKIITKNNDNHNFHKIYGTPGIGKSIFLNRIFYYIIESYRISGNKNSITISYNLKKFKSEFHYIIYLYKEDDNLKFKFYDSSNRIGREKVDYYIADTFPPSKAKIFSIYVSSYNQSNYIAPRPGIAGVDEFMPLFSYDELSLLSPQAWTDDQRKFRYSILGGCARNYLIQQYKSDIFLEDFLQEAVELFIPQKFRTPTLENDRNESINPYYSHFLDICSILKGTFVRNFDEKDPQQVNILIRPTIHFLPFKDSYKAVWSSLIIKLISSFIRENMDKKIWNQISSLISESAKGGLFESSVHSKLISSRNKAYKFKYLDGDMVTIKEIELHISGLKYIWSSDGIAELEDNEYGLPLKQNFGAVDAIIQPNILIQITVADKHPVKKHILEEYRKKLRGDKSTHMLIYIIESNVKSFKINNLSYKPPQTRSITIAAAISANINAQNNEIDTISNYFPSVGKQNELIFDTDTTRIHNNTTQNDEILQLVGYIDANTDVLNNLEILP